MVVDQPLRESLLAQARLRLRLGMPALLFIVGAVYLYDAAHQQFEAHEMGVLSLAYVAYCVATYWFSIHNTGRWDKALLGTTVAGDPLMLSAFLYAAGDGAILFVGFYLFTILGFGFRVGIRSMRWCQGIAIVGFVMVAMYSPAWREMLMVTASHILLLIVVPLYASGLIRGLRDAQMAAKYESEAKSKLLANVSHELRTPLTGIISAAQLIQAETAGGDVINAKARSITDMAWHLDGEISQLLDLSKLQLGTSKDEVVAFTVDNVISNVVDAVQAAVTAKNLALTVRIDPSISVPVKGMAQSLRSVLINLVGNAIKFTDAGRVDVSAEAIETNDAHYVVRFRVSDTGIGIPAEHLSKIFEPFYQVERGTNRKYGGTGLGMAISKEHVARLGGRIEVRSTVGEGSVFWFDIPLEKAHIGSETQAEDASAQVVLTKRVLLADDNATNLALIREMLCRDGHEVVAATSGTEALSHLATDAFDIVMLDYNMHDIDGAQVWSIYSMSRTKPAPTYFITADTTVATKDRLLSLGAAGVMYKPITFAMIRKTLHAAFPDEIAPVAERTPRPSAQTPVQANVQTAAQAAYMPNRLTAVATEYLAHDALENLREINPSDAFAKRLLSDAKDDIAQIALEMSIALAEGNVPAVRRQGHAMKGVSLNIGAPRLAAFGEKAMTSSFEAIHGQRKELEDNLKQEVAGTVAAIEGLLSDIDRVQAPAEAGAQNGRS